MKHKKKRYQLGGGLPQFNFQPFVMPVAQLPLEAFGETTNVLNQNYDTSLENLNQLRQAQSALKAAPLDADQQYLKSIMEDFNNQYSNIKEQGDFENQLTRTNMLLSDFKSKAIPIAQRQQEVRQVLDQINKSDIANKARARQAALAAFNQQPVDIDETTGNLVNNLDTSAANFVFTPDVNLTEEIAKIARFAKGDSRTLPPSLYQMKDPQSGETIANLLRSRDVTELTPDQVATIAKGLINSNQNIQAYRQREDMFDQMLGYEPQQTIDGQTFDSTFEQQVYDAIESSKETFGFRDVKDSYKVFNSIFDKKSGDSNDDPNTYGNIYGFADGFQSQDPINSTRVLNSKVATLQEKVNNGTATTTDRYDLIKLNLIQRKLDKEVDVILKDKTPEEKELLKKYADLSDEELSNALNRTGAFAGTGSPLGVGVSKSLTDDEYQQLYELRQSLTNTQENKLKEIYNVDSQAPETMRFNNVKSKGLDESTSDYLNAAIQEDIRSFDIITQDGATLEEFLETLSGEEKERIEELSTSDGSITNIATELNANRMTKVPIKNGTPAIVAKVGTKFSDVLGKEIMLVPKQGYNSNIFTEMVNRGAVNTEDSRNADVIALTRMNPNRSQTAEQAFQSLINYTPNLFDEGEDADFVIAPGLPKIAFTVKDGTFNYRFVHPDTGETMSSGSSSNFIDIRHEYYKELLKKR